MRNGHCDFPGCTYLPTLVCRCRRCDREPEADDKFHCCFEHITGVGDIHERVYRRLPDWGSFSQPGTVKIPGYRVPASCINGPMHQYSLKEKKYVGPSLYECKVCKALTHGPIDPIHMADDDMNDWHPDGEL